MKRNQHVQQKYFIILRMVYQYIIKQFLMLVCKHDRKNITVVPPSDHSVKYKSSWELKILLEIPVVEQYEFLGVIFDKKLSFIPHNNYLKAKCHKALTPACCYTYRFGS